MTSGGEPASVDTPSRIHAFLIPVPHDLISYNVAP